uniref:Interleukin-13 receptor subunit alpha-1 n=1 Tax=Petromyzon marinus TaxID=7757 RepID=A0AAJ7U424_PETMA|nr:interleukin-13 receptor subunit alpha-1 [Petromyzon marinus]
MTLSPCCLCVILLLLGAASRCRPELDLKPPTQVRLEAYVEGIRLPVRWKPVPLQEKPAHSLLYQLRLCLPANKDARSQCEGSCVCQQKKKGRKVLGRPDQEVTVSVRSVAYDDEGTCPCPSLDSASNASAWTKPLAKPPVGEPGTAARDVSCVYRDMEALECRWSPGEKAPPGTNYSLYYAVYLDEPLLWTRCGDDERMLPGTSCVSRRIVDLNRDANSFAILVNGTLPSGEPARPSLLDITPLETISPSAPQGLRASVLNLSNMVFVWDPPNNTRLLSFIKYHARLVIPRAGAEPQVLADTLIEKRTTLDLVVDPGLPYRVSVRAIPIYFKNLSSPWSHLDYSPKSPDPGPPVSGPPMAPLVIAFGAVLAVITAISFLVWRWPRMKVQVWPDIPDPAGPLDAFLKRNIDPVKAAGCAPHVEAQDPYSLVEELDSPQLLRPLPALLQPRDPPQ